MFCLSLLYHIHTMEAGALRAEKQQNEEIVRNLKDPVILEKIVFHLPFSTTFGTKLTGQNDGGTQDIPGSIQHVVIIWVIDSILRSEIRR